MTVSEKGRLFKAIKWAILRHIIIFDNQLRSQRTSLDIITGSSVAEMLRKVEERHEFVGTLLLEVFFPSYLRAKEDNLDFWRRAIAKRMEPNRLDNLPAASPRDENPAAAADGAQASQILSNLLVQLTA
jgi:hypothetical protein